jgi:GT2 family glycosyltransferase
MKNPLVSVITVNYRQAAITCALLDSIRQNSYKNLEVIVVDNGSEQDCTASFQKHYPAVKVLMSQDNLGFAGGNNLGIKAAKGDFIFLVNNDTEWTDGLVEALLKRFSLDDSIGVVSPKIRYHHTPDMIQYAGFTEINPLTGRNETVGKNEKDHGQYDTASLTPYAHGAAMMLKKEVIKEVGLMPENYFLYYEELDWCHQIKEAGYELWYEPQGLIYHKESASVGKLSTLKLYYLTRNRLLFMRRNIKGWRLGLFLSYFFSITFPLKSLFFLIKGEWNSFLMFQKAIFNFK